MDERFDHDLHIHIWQASQRPWCELQRRKGWVLSISITDDLVTIESPVEGSPSEATLTRES